MGVSASALEGSAGSSRCRHKAGIGSGWQWLRANGVYLATAAAVFAISLAHTSPNSYAFNYFDPLKRLLWASLALFLFYVVGRSKAGGNSELLNALAGALGLWMVARTLCRPHPRVEIEVLFSWLLPLTFFVLGQRLRGLRGLKSFVLGLQLSALLQAILMLLQRAGYDPLFAETTSAMDYAPGRMIGAIGYHNQAVDYLALCGATTFINIRSTILRRVSFAFLVAVVGLTGNRGGIAALLCAVFFSEAAGLWLTRTKRRHGLLPIVGWGTGLGILAVGFLLSLPITGERIRETVSNLRQSQAFGSRLIMANIGIGMWKESPWVGWGSGEYAFQYLTRLGASLPAQKTHEVLRNVTFARETHNDAVQFAAEFGLVGLTLAALLLAAGLAALWKRRAADPPRTCSAVFTLVYLALAGLVAFPWQTSMAGPLAGLLLGICVPSLQDPATVKEPRLTKAGPAIRWIGSAALGLWLVCSLGWYACNAFWNSVIAERLAHGETSFASAWVPRWAGNYQALIGASYAAQGNPAAAEKVLLRARMRYSDVLLLNNLGNALASQGKWAEALPVYRAWEATGISYSNALNNLSVAYEQLGQYPEAGEAVKRLLELWPQGNLRAVRRLAVLRLRSGDVDGFLRLFRRHERLFLRRSPPLPDDVENLGGLGYMLLGRRAEAEKHFRAALEKNPKSEGARRNLDLLTRYPTNDYRRLLSERLVAQRPGKAASGPEKKQNMP